MKYLALYLCLLFPSCSFAISLSKANQEYLKECEVLLEQVEQSKCGKHTLAFLRNAYLKIGLTISQRSLTFEHSQTKKTLFDMEGQLTPIPFITASLGDSYFKNSNFGYQLGGSYFSDTAFDQAIERDGKVKVIDLQTYSKMTVLAFTPTLFYSIGRSTPNDDNYFTIGLGLTAGYSKVKGNAYVTNDESNANCYNTGSEYVLNNGNPFNIFSECEFGTYESDGLSYGARIYMAYEYHNWVTEISGSNYNHDIDGGLTFSTFDFSLSLSRKFSF